jgi:hypothetical protein
MSDISRLLERLISDTAFRAEFDLDPAGTARSFGVDDRFAAQVAALAQTRVDSLDRRESRSSLAGAFVAALAEAVGIVEAGGHLFGVQDAQAATLPVWHADQFGAHGTGGPITPETETLLHDSNVQLDAAGVADLSAGRIDPRIVTVLVDLSHEHRLTISAMVSDHSEYTAGGSISNHYYGRAVDIATVDGQPVSPGNEAAKQIAISLSTLDPSIRPTEIGSPWALPGAAYFTDAEHQNHLHVAFDDPIAPNWQPPAADVAVSAPAPVADPPEPSDDSSESDGAADQTQADDSDDDNGDDSGDDSSSDEESDSDSHDDGDGPDGESGGDDDSDSDSDSDSDDDSDSDGDAPGEGSNGEDANDDQSSSDSSDPSNPSNPSNPSTPSDTSDSGDSGDSGDSSDSDSGNDPAAAAPVDSAADAASSYPGDSASREQVAAWLAAGAENRGLPPELPVMAALVESGVANLDHGDADSVGLFQMRTSVWNNGPYAGYADNPQLQLQWFLDHAEAVKSERLRAGLPLDSAHYGDWIADIERPAEQFRGRYQLRLDEARELLAHAAQPLPPSANVAQTLPAVPDHGS